jgi:hypothetical protein
MTVFYILYNVIAPIETASFFVAGAAKRRPGQKRYSGEREIAPEKIIND